MYRNLSLADRLIRATLGAVILLLVFFGPQTPWGYVGLIALLSAISGFCPLYKIIGIRTCPYHPSDK